MIAFAITSAIGLLFQEDDLARFGFIEQFACQTLSDAFRRWLAHRPLGAESFRSFQMH